MKPSSVWITLAILLLHLYFAIPSDARNLLGSVEGSKQKEKINAVKHTLFEQMMKQFNLAQQLDSSSNAQPYGISSPFTLPPYESLPPATFSENTPPDCENPPTAPQNPGSSGPVVTAPNPPDSSTTLTPPVNVPGISGPELGPPGSSSFPTPPTNVPGISGPELGPPSSSSFPTPPTNVPGISGPELGPPGSSSFPTPPINVPGPSGPVLGPPDYESAPPSSEPGTPITVPNPPDSSSNPNPPITVPSPSEPVLSPPEYEQGPPISNPSPSIGTPSPIGFHPPVVFPPPTVQPPPRGSSPGSSSLWCVAKPTVPDPIIQEAMNYACASGADCEPIQPSGPCYQPNTLWAHASFAFNSYWQKSKGAGGSCEFGGTGMLVTIDPSYSGCHFDYY